MSKRSQKAINIITIISIVVMVVVSAAMVVVLSTMNGVSGLVEKIYSPFDQDITITPSHGKTLDRNDPFLRGLLEKKQVAQGSFFIEENVLLKCGQQQTVATLKGVEPSYLDMANMQRYLYSGKNELMHGDEEMVLMGIGLKVELNAPLNDGVYRPLEIAAPIRGKKLSKYKQAAFQKERVAVSGSFSMNIEYDTKYVLAPLSMATRLLHYDSLVSGLELAVKPGADLDDFAAALRTEAGDNLLVRTRYQKNELMYRTNQSEKWFTFLVLLFIALIGAFNIIASLTMMMIEKKQDMKMLTSLGATASTVRTIFFLEGLLIVLTGALIGIALGLLICWLQQSFGFIKLEGSIVDAYPVQVLAKDLLLVFAAIMSIGIIASWIPLRSLSRRYLVGR